MQEIPTVQQPIPPQQPPMYPPPTYQPPQKPPRSNKRLWLILGIVAAILLVGGIIGGIVGTQGQTTTTPSAIQPTQQVTTQPTTPTQPTQPTQPVKPVVVQPRIMGSIADFDAAYGEPYEIMTDQQMHVNGMDRYADRGAYYKIGNSHLLVASAGGTVVAIAGPKSVDYKQYFPEGLNAAHGPDEQTDTTDIYNVYSGTSVIGKMEVDDNREPWAIIYRPTIVYPPQ